MQFDLPTTKEGMYETLNDIYVYYHNRMADYDGIVLQPLSITKLTAPQYTDAEIRALASAMLKGKQEERLTAYKIKLKDKQDEIADKIIKKKEEYAALKLKTAESYETAKTKLNKTAIKNGLAASGIWADKTAGIEKEKNLAIAAVEAEEKGELALLEQKSKDLALALENAASFYQDLDAAEITSKVQELKQSNSEYEKEVAKYNAQASEKELKYGNNILQINASLRLRFLQIHATGLTKDELVQLGYYQDALNCVCAYYNTLAAQAAYDDIKNESKLIIYLDDYYQNVLYLYKTRAN